MTKTYEPQVMVETAELPEEEWLEYRRRGIGGSDAAIVLGISPFATARDLYFDKLKIAGYGDEGGNWVAKRIGHLLEDLVAEIFSRKTGYPIYKIHKMFYHPEYPFMLADIDFFVTLPNGETAILEIKTTNYNARDHWFLDGKEIVPSHYEAQGRHYMCVMNVDHVFYCCLYGNNEDEVIIRHITRDRVYEEELIAVESYFWKEYVGKSILPPYTEDGERVLESVRNHVGPADLKAPEITLTLPMASCVQRFTELQAQKRLVDAESKRLEGEMKRMQGQVVAEMGKSCFAACTAGDQSYTVTYKPVFKSDVSKNDLIRLQLQHPDIYREFVTVSESRRFYVKKAKPEAA